MVLVMRDAEVRAEWYRRAFRFVLARHSTTVPALIDWAVAPKSFTFTSLFHELTRQFPGLAQPIEAAVRPFDWTQVDLQCFAFHVDERSLLDDWSRHLDQLGITHLDVTDGRSPAARERRHRSRG